MALFRRSKPLHEQLADAGGLELGSSAGAGYARPPGWDGEPSPFGEPGIHGVPRARRWDTVASADTSGLRGSAVHFVALPDRTLIVDEDEPADAVAELAAVLEEAISPPYRAEAVRRGGTLWGVAASRIDVIEAPELEGEAIELTMVDGRRTLIVDGGPSLQPSRALALAGERRGRDYVVRARRLDGELWQVEPSAL